MTERDQTDAHDVIRPGELAVALPGNSDAGLFFIGRIATPWRRRGECPRRGDVAGPLCTITLDARFAPALTGIEPGGFLQVLYWMDRARRDLLLQRPGHGDRLVGTFGVRSPVRPNPIASSVVLVERIEGATLFVRGLDCLDGTPLLDLKPERCPNS